MNSIKQFLSFALKQKKFNFLSYSKLAVKENPEKEHPIIACKNSKLNHYRSTHYDKFDQVILASKGWHNRKSRGDFFIINPKNKSQIEDEDSKIKSWKEINIDDNIIEILCKQRITKPTLIQSIAIENVLTGKNCLIAAETGCGKTLAYLLPIIQQILNWKQIKNDKYRKMNSPLGVIILPSRELAEQIGELSKQFGYDLNFNVKILTGGHTKRKMTNPEFEPVDLLVATLGAVSKLTTVGIYRMNECKHLVLDEADTLLDSSFSEKLVHFLKKFHLQYGGLTNEVGTQFTLVSATMPKNVYETLETIIPPESFLQITTNKLHRVLDHVPQKFIRLSRTMKPSELLSVVKKDYDCRRPILIFSNRSPTCDWVSLFLNENNIKCDNLNGEMRYEIRLGKFRQFQSGELNVLSCTDIGSRGLDTVRVQHVLNYDFPLYMADYIHRCGRTGRVGSSKNCHITNFVASEREIHLVRKIEMAVRKMAELPNVDGNITELIQQKIIKDIKRDFMQDLNNY